MNVYKGQYTNDIYWWTDQKPRIFFSTEDLRIFTPLNAEAYEKDMNRRITNLQLAKPHADASMMARWKRDFPIGTRICQSARSSGAPVLIPGIRMDGVLVGYVEGYSDTKVKIHVVELTTIPNFQDTYFWNYPDNKWYRCD